MVTLAFALLADWPTRRRPSRVFHCTTAAAESRVVEDLAAGRDGTLYCFTTAPSRRRRSFNVAAASTVVLELVDVDYRQATVRYRPVDCAVRITGTITARPAPDREPPAGQAD